MCCLIPSGVADQILKDETKRVILYTVPGSDSSVDPASLNNTAVTDNCTIVLRAPELNFLVAQIPVNNSSFYQNELLKIPGVSSIDTDSIRLPESFSPDSSGDINISDQWAFNRTDTARGWSLLKPGSMKPVTIAILDTGIDVSHQDLNQFINSHGFDWVENRSTMTDEDGHGTFLAGIICAMAGPGKNQTKFINLSLIPERVGTNISGIYASRSAAAIQHAADNGARIILMGYGGQMQSPAEESAITYAVKKGCVLIAPAGNEASNEGHYPSDYTDVISVGSTAKTDGLSYFSNYGIFVDLVAPGEGVVSSWPGNLTQTVTGTSPAAALVAGAACLVNEANPDLSNGDIRSILESTSHDLGRTGRDIYYGYGLLDVGEAVAEAEKRHTAIWKSIVPAQNSSGVDQIKRSVLLGKETVEITLSPGWNFMSVPSFPASGKTSGDLFKDINTEGHTIWKFDPIIQDWVAVEKQTNFTPLEGFLLFSNRQITLPLVLENPDNTRELHMSAGWNLIGSPNLTPISAKDALLSLSQNWISLLQYNTSMQSYDPAVIPGANGSHADSRMLSPFSAYWVYMNSGSVYHPA